MLNAYDLKSFYNSFHGRMVRKIIRKTILALWEDCQDRHMVGYGYALPYLKPYMEQTDRMVHLSFRRLVLHNWPEDSPNCVALTLEDMLPIETNSVDRLMMIHALEFVDDPGAVLKEAFRILKSTGRLMIIVPNRLGLWARADWTPFGQGQPFSASQVEQLLKDNLFVHEKTAHALFLPPFRKTVFYRSANFFEKIGGFLCPALSGVHIIEASKQIYANISSGSKAPVTRKMSKPVTADPVTTPRKNYPEG